MAISHLAETNRLITSLSEMIMKEKVEAKDPFWNNSTRQLLESLIGFFLEEYKLGNINREQITMTSIRKFQNSSMAEKNFAKFKEYLETREYGTKFKDSLTSIITASENTYKSITSVLGSKMSLFDDVNLVDTKGFNVLDGKSIFAHYTNEKTLEVHEKYKQYLSSYSSNQEEVVALPEEDTIFVNNGEFELIGSIPYYEFITGKENVKEIEGSKLIR